MGQALAHWAFASGAFAHWAFTLGAFAHGTFTPWAFATWHSLVRHSLVRHSLASRVPRPYQTVQLHWLTPSWALAYQLVPCLGRELAKEAQAAAIPRHYPRGTNLMLRGRMRPNVSGQREAAAKQRSA